MAEHARRVLRGTGQRDGGSRIGRAGSWWLALVVVCSAGLLVIGVLAVAGRLHPKPDPVAGTAATGKSSATPRVRASTATPAASPSPSPARASLISSAPPAPARAPSPGPAPAPKPSPEPSPVASSSPPGYLTLTPASGAATLTPTWASSACPAGYQGSAVLYELNTDGSIASSISATAYSVSAPFSGTLDGPVGELITLGSDVQAGGTSTWVAGCFAGIGGTGAEQRTQSVSVTLSADGSSYSTSAG